MKLYGSTNSGHSYKVRLFLTLAQIDHDYEWVDIFIARDKRPQHFIDIARYGEVPVLVDDGVVYCQSNAILQYLSQKFNIYGGDQRVAQWLFWETNRIGFSLPNYRFAKVWQPLADDAMAYLRGRMLTDLKILNTALAGQNYIVGDGLTIADLSLSGYMFWLEQADIDISDYAHIQRWQDNIKALPHWQAPTTLLAKNRLKR